MMKFIPIRSLALGAALSTTLALAATPTSETAGERLDDATIATRIKADLVAHPVTKARDIDVAVYKGHVQLNGFVESDAERAQALAIARHVDGVGAVDNNLELQGAPQTMGADLDDGALTTAVKAALLADERTKARQIHVETRAAVVQLGGFVDDDTARGAAVEIAKGIKGVARVDNRLAIKR